LLPVLVIQLREKRYPISGARAFLSEARAELEARERLLNERKLRLQTPLCSRSERRFLETCLEQDQRWLLLAFEALKGLERYLRNHNPAFLSHALADFRAAERQFEVAIRKRQHPPSAATGGARQAA
jgi:hypothetical protein